MTIVEFLLERLDEEQDAAERTQPGPWVAVPAAMPGEVEIRHQMPDGRPDVSAAVATTHGLRCAAQDADHIARYNPARVLAEVAVKRELLRLHGPMSVVPGSEWFNDAHLTKEPMRLCRSCEPEKMFRREQSYPCRTLLALALPYADHPDHRQEWA